MMTTILIALSISLIVSALPFWPHSRAWGYAPSGKIGLISIILLILVVGASRPEPANRNSFVAKPPVDENSLAVNDGGPKPTRP